MTVDLSSFQRQLGLIQGMGNFDVAPKYPTFKINPPTMGGLNPATGGGDFESFVRAISGQESGGNYRAVNPTSGALGKYQIMPGNIPSWSKSILGKSVSTQQFLNNSSLQEQIARGMLQRYYRQYGAAGAAAAWYGGPGVAKKWSNMRNPQGAYPSIYNYVTAILKRMRS